MPEGSRAPTGHAGGLSAAKNKGGVAVGIEQQNACHSNAQGRKGSGPEGRAPFMEECTWQMQTGGQDQRMAVCTPVGGMVPAGAVSGCRVPGSGIFGTGNSVS